MSVDANLCDSFATGGMNRAREIPWVEHRQPHLSEEQLQRTAELNPNHALILHNLGEVFLAQGRLTEAIREMERSVELSGQISGVPSSHYLAMLGCAYARASRSRDAADILDELMRRDQKDLVSAFDMASLHTALGEKDEALTWLERGYDRRDVWLAEVNVWPWLDPLRDDLRFQALLGRMKLPFGPEGST